MPRGGYRPGAGRPKGSKNKPKAGQQEAPTKAPKAKSKPQVPDDIKAEAEKANLTPVEWMLQKMNDDSLDIEFRLKIAQIAAPYVHGNPNAKPSKKQEREDRASKAGKGRFSPAAPPSLKAVK